MSPAFGVEIAIIQNNQVLLTQRADLPVWCLPGGAVEAHESLAHAAIRETVEETGLSVDLTRMVGVYSRPQWGEGAHVILFAAAPVSGTLLTTTNETVDARFFATNALPSTLLWWYHQRIADAFAHRPAVAWTQNAEWPWDNLSRAEMYQRLLRGEFILADVVAQLCRMPTAGQESLDV